MTIELDFYRLFAAIAQHGGLSPAARALSVSKSMLSARLRRLEDELGVRLVERTSRQFKLTDAGHRLLTGCSVVLAVAAETELAISEAQTEPRGVIRVSCPFGLSRDLIAKVLPSFMIQYPLVEVEVLVSNEKVDLISDSVDVAFRARTALEDDQSFIVRIIARNRRSLVASPDLLKLHPALREIADVRRLPTLGMGFNAGPETWTLLNSGGSLFKMRVTPRLRCSDFDVLLEAALAGVGVALLPDHLCRYHVDERTLTTVLPEWSAPEAIVHMVYTSKSGLRPAVRQFVDHVAKEAALLQRLTPKRWSQ